MYDAGQTPQEPWMHTVLEEQGVPQAPQLFRSDLRFWHEPEQFVSPDGQTRGGVTQVPATQDLPDGHAFPHVPQFALLLPRSKQELPHNVSAPVHVTEAVGVPLTGLAEAFPSAPAEDTAVTR
jgi:hypothetical protein